MAVVRESRDGKVAYSRHREIGEANGMQEVECSQLRNRIKTNREINSKWCLLKMYKEKADELKGRNSIKRRAYYCIGYNSEQVKVSLYLTEEATEICLTILGIRIWLEVEYIHERHMPNVC